MQSNEFDSFPKYYESKKGINQENQMIGNQTSLAVKLLKEGLIDKVEGNYSAANGGVRVTLSSADADPAAPGVEVTAKFEMVWGSF